MASNPIYSRIYTYKALIIHFLCVACIHSIPLNAEILKSDRRITWNPGIPGGIPLRAIVYSSVREAPYNAKGDGLTDDTMAIQNAINDCPAGQTVYLPAGTYRIAGELLIDKGIVLRGDGPSATKIKLHSSSDNIIRIGNWRATNIVSVISGYSKGSTTVVVQDASDFSEGDYVLIDQENDSKLVDRRDCTWCSRDEGRRAVGQITRIIKKNETTFLISPSLYFSYSSSYNPEILRLSDNVVEYAGVEDLYVERVNPGGHNNIRIQYGAYCWIKNVESYNAYERHVQIHRSYGCVVRDSYFHHAHDYLGGHGYGVSLFDHTSATLVENNIFYNLRHAMILEAGASGNVFGYNYSEKSLDDNSPSWLMADISSHGAHPCFNLFESNAGNHIGPDYVHGSASHQTYFRNYIDMSSPGASEHILAVDIHRYNYYMNLVGNVFGKPGDTGAYEIINKYCDNHTTGIYKLGYTSDGDCAPSENDTNVVATLLRHGNYDYVTQSARWDPDISERELPDSYYMSSRPSFIDDELSWPLIGPDVVKKFSILPAQRRFLTPINLRIVR